MKKILILLMLFIGCDSDNVTGLNDDNTEIPPLVCSETVELFGVVYDVETTTAIYREDYGLTGNIPSEIGCLVNLEYLDLEDNQLIGEIPPEIGYLVNLEYLDLENNQLTGDIPNSVRELILNINSLCGYTSLIENQLNDASWINENACGDNCECDAP